MKEIWVLIDWNGILLNVSNLGEIKDKLGRVKHQNTSFKYNRIYVNGKHELVHRIVATAFIPNPYGLETVNHIDGDKRNNRVDNLEWCSRQENSLKASGKEKGYVVEQRTLSGKLVSVFSSQREAARVTGIHREAITMCCEGRRNIAGGFCWSCTK